MWRSIFSICVTNPQTKNQHLLKQIIHTPLIISIDLNLIIVLEQLAFS